MSWRTKFLLSILIDLLDFTIGRLAVPIPGLGEAIGAFFCILMWGPAGLLYLLEMADVTEQVDGFAPTATLIALTRFRAAQKKAAEAKRLGAKSRSGPQSRRSV